MLDILSAIILGAVQGITEFLPISSSGHLVLIPQLLGVQTGLAFDTILHLGTLVAIFSFFWKDILRLIGGFIGSLIDITNGNFKKGIQNNISKKFAWLLIIGTIPTGIMGILFKDAIESVFRGTIYVGVFLLITGLILYYSQRHSSGKVTTKEMTFKKSLIIGICQGLAIFPGISRSGATIASGLCIGLEREYAARYSFLLSVPAVVGAGLIQIKDITSLDMSIVAIIAGFISSIIFGYYSIKLLIKMIKGWSLDVFAYYCWIVGALTIILTLIFG